MRDIAIEMRQDLCTNLEWRNKFVPILANILQNGTLQYFGRGYKLQFT